eukprot:2545835-Prymnesium_polylepis.1
MATPCADADLHLAIPVFLGPSTCAGLTASSGLIAFQAGGSASLCVQSLGDVQARLTELSISWTPPPGDSVADVCPLSCRAFGVGPCATQPMLPAAPAPSVPPSPTLPPTLPYPPSQPTPPHPPVDQPPSTPPPPSPPSLPPVPPVPPPVPPPSLPYSEVSPVSPPIECSGPNGPCDETLIMAATELYRGCQNSTRSGLACQRWDSQYPHSHARRPERVSGLDSNYCRNPDNEPTIWCYTTDPNERWDFCDPLYAPSACLSPPPAPYDPSYSEFPSVSAISVLPFTAGSGSQYSLPGLNGGVLGPMVAASETAGYGPSPYEVQALTGEFAFDPD